MCLESKKYTQLKLAGEFVGLLARLSKSILFNLFIFVLGACIGYVTIASKVHYYATKHTDMQYIDMVEDKITELEQLDALYTEKQIETKKLIDQYKQKLSHDVHHECETNLGKYLFQSK